MADNIELNSGAGGAVLAADEIGGVKHQRVKVEHGGDGEAIDVSNLTPLPVRLSTYDRDAFGRQRVSVATSLAHFKNLDDVFEPYQWSESTAGGGSASTPANISARRLSVGTASGDEVVRQTRRRFEYEPGKSLLLHFTFVLGAAKANLRQRAGLFDVNDGLFLEQDGADVNLVLRSSTSGSPVETRIAQADWNIDAMDGNGVSGITLDLTKAQLFFVDMQWLGVGEVRFGFYVGGRARYIHVQQHANLTSVVYMKNPNLPARFEITNTGVTASASQLDQICLDAVIEADGSDPLGVEHSADRGASERQITNTEMRPLISLRMQSAFVGFGTLGRIIGSVITTSNENMLLTAWYNPTFGAGTGPTWVQPTGSIAEYDISRTTPITGGLKILSQYVANDVNQLGGIEMLQRAGLLALGSSVAGVSDEIVLAGQTDSGNGNALAGLNWLERL